MLAMPIRQTVPVDRRHSLSLLRHFFDIIRSIVQCLMKNSVMKPLALFF